MTLILYAYEIKHCHFVCFYIMYYTIELRQIYLLDINGTWSKPAFLINQKCFIYQQQLGVIVKFSGSFFVDFMEGGGIHEFTSSTKLIIIIKKIKLLRWLNKIKWVHSIIDVDYNITTIDTSWHHCYYYHVCSFCQSIIETIYLDPYWNKI